MKTRKPAALLAAAAAGAVCLTGFAADGAIKTAGDEILTDFTAMRTVPSYSAENGSGFCEYSDAIMPDAYRRRVSPIDNIELSADGAKVTESDGAYLGYTSSNQYNYGGLIYRVDTGSPGAYHLEVTVTGSSSDTRVAPTGMQASRLTSDSDWDNCGEVPRTVSAKWSGSTWSYDFATGEDFVEIEIEPASLPSETAPKTVGVKSIKITPLENNPAGAKPTIRILGDSTQKTYSFDETISSWGQTIGNYFDSDKADVINYSMGGRAMKSSYAEGRFDEVLLSGREGDYVLIHSAHNDETISTDRFERGAAVLKDGLEENNANYAGWLDMYVSAIKARGMTPVLVTAMPRINSSTGRYTESAVKPNGFNPDSPGLMRAKAAADSGTGLIELYDGAKSYIDSLDPKEVSYIYNMIEAGETPAANSANGASGDGTHYRESAAKQWCRIMLQSVYDQSVSEEDVYGDKAIMRELTSYMREDVKAAAQSGDWSAVFPEIASDVSAVGVVPGAEKQPESNFYYRTSIEKALQLGLLHKDANNLFKPTQTITVGEYARGIEKAFGLAENSLTNYKFSFAELQSEFKPMEEPRASISRVTASGGNTEVTLENAVSGVVIAAEYDGAGLARLKTAEVNGTSTVLTGIEADKVFLWETLSEQKPLCSPRAADAEEQPTEPAEQPTEPAEQPTEPADRPTEPADRPTPNANECLITVTPPEGGTVTVYNESAFKTATADIPAGITEGQAISDNDFFTLTAPQTISAGTDKSGIFAENTDISVNYADFRNDGREFVYTAKADGTLTVYARTGGNKTIELAGSETRSSYMNDSDTAHTESNVYGTVHFSVTAGQTYKLYTRGGTGRLFGVMYASADYPQSTEFLIVNRGDTVRVTAAAGDNYVNNAILVNGAEVTRGKEYSFTADADTTVTASFAAEPPLVSDTFIASDAALTREAMGAILYDAYQLADDGVKAVMADYISNNGGVPSPDDPNYDPNIKYEGTPYIPLTGWGALTDTGSLSDELYAKVKAAYNLGLIRPETGIARGAAALGTELEPTAEVTRAKAAKSLVFCFILTQPKSRPSQTVPDGFAPAEPREITAPNPDIR